MEKRRDVVGSRAAHRRRRPSHRGPRAAVLVALALATVGAPLAHALAPVEVVATPAEIVAQGPSLLDVYADRTPAQVPTSALAALPVTVRLVEDVSRSLDREALPGCDGTARTDFLNGQVADSDLCVLWDGSLRLRGDAAIALTELNDNFVAVFGRNICLTDAYRSYADQVRLAETKGSLAATPGRSNHGWGLAVDLCSSETRGETFSWIQENGPVFGWVNPRWAQAGGVGPYEPWHWEFLVGTEQYGTNW